MDSFSLYILCIMRWNDIFVLSVCVCSAGMGNLAFGIWQSSVHIPNSKCTTNIVLYGITVAHP